MHTIMRLLRAFIALVVWVPVFVAGEERLRDRALSEFRQVNGLTKVQVDAILRLHNAIRAREPASDMIRMEWDPILAKSAQEHANTCVTYLLSDEQRKNVGGYSYIGNIASSQRRRDDDEKFDPLEIVKYWYREKLDPSPGASKESFHQIVWAESRALGCGAKYCRSQKSVYLICYYGPGPAQMSELKKASYTEGEKCSKCPKEQSHCVENLCYHSPAKEDEKGKGKKEVKKIVKEVKKEEKTEDNASATKASNDGLHLRASCLVPILLSCATLAQIMHY